jgi:hypothetical protein
MTVFSGMLMSTVIGVILVPALYIFVDRLANRPKKTAPVVPEGADS